MARSRSALEALPPARQRAFEAYLCGTIFTGAENARRGRSAERGARTGGLGQECPFPSARRTPGRRKQPLRARDARGPGPGRCGRAGRRREDSRRRGAGTRHPHGRACAARPPRPGPPRPQRRQRPAPRARRRAGRKTRAGARRGRGRRRAATAAQSRSRLREGEARGWPGPADGPRRASEQMRRVRAHIARPTVSRNPKVLNRPRPFLEKSYFPGFREIAITSILNLEGNVRPFQGKKKDVKSGLAPGNTASGFGPVPGVHPLVPTPEHTWDMCSLK